MLKIQFVNYKDARDTIHGIRHEVFTLEQFVDAELDFDGQDEAAFQVIACCNEKPAGTGRMLADGHIGRIAVLKEFRKQGTGTLIMQSLIDLARQKNIAKVFLGAQVTAVPFYATLGFQADGKNYMEAGIEHTPMTLTLDKS